MIWKVVIVILCLLWWLPMVYMWFSMKRINKLIEEYEEVTDDCEAYVRIYRSTTEQVQKSFGRLEDSIDNQRKIVNGWQHKIDIMDRDIRKLKKEE